MSSYAPPSGPPPPAVPHGWKAQFDDRYKQWFFVNLKTGVSQWTPPEGPTDHDAPPPAYDDSRSPAIHRGNDRKSPLQSNNPYNNGRPPVNDDERLARQLQAEEDARAAGNRSRGESSSYYNPNNNLSTPPPASSMQHNSRPTSSNGNHARGFFGGPSRRTPPPPPQPPYPNPQGYPRYPPGPPPPPGYGYPPPGPGYYPPPQPGYYAPQPVYIVEQAPMQQQQGGFHMGTAGAAALGVGGGLLAGALITDAIEDDNRDDYGYGGPSPDYGGGYDDGPGFF